MWKEWGIHFDGTFYSFGQYDAVSLLEADNDNDVRYALLQAERQGNSTCNDYLSPITHEEAVRLAESYNEKSPLSKMSS